VARHRAQGYPLKNKTAISVILCGAVVGASGVGGGCTPTVYRNWADSQVQDILRDRKKTTLGYQPEVEAKLPANEKPSRAAYEKIPVTPIPPQVASPLEPSVVTVPFGELGPDVPAADAGDSMSRRSPNPYDQAVLSGGTTDELRLGPQTPAEMGTQLDLFRAIEYGVQHSRQYQTQMEDLYLRTLDVTLQRWLLSPRPFVTQDFNVTGGQRDAEYRSALNAVTTAGVRQRLPYGGEVVARTLASTVRAIDGNVQEGQSASVALDASIPLLRGAGLVNLEGLIGSERQLVYEIRDFEQFRREFAVDIATRYFRLITQQQRLQNSRMNFVGLQRLTMQTQAMYQSGRANFLDVQLSAQQMLRAESQIISAENAYRTALDLFKIVLGMPIDTDLQVVPVELELNEPQDQVNRAIELATQYRLDLQTSRDQIEDARRRVSNAKNELLPEVNLTAGTSLGSRPEDPLFGFEGRSQQYSAGLRIDLPVDRLAERNAYRASLIGLQRAQRGYEQQRDQIAVAARDALRGIAQARTSLEIQRIGIEMAQKRLDNSRELLRAGIQASGGSTRSAVEAQQSLLETQNEYADARAQLQISVLNYLRETGTLRVDPSAGALGVALDRGAVKRKNNLPTPG
jgi:outer membrane protein TolC